MVFKKIKNWWKKMEGRYGHLEGKDAFLMGRTDATILGLQAKEERKKRKAEKKSLRKLKRGF